MKIDLEAHFHFHDNLSNEAVQTMCVSIDELLSTVNGLVTTQGGVMAELTELGAEVRTNTTVVGSAITLIHGLAEKFEACKNDPAAVQALVDEMRTTNTALAATVAANTDGPVMFEPPAV